MSRLSNRLAAQARRIPRMGGGGGRKRLPVGKGKLTAQGYRRTTVGNKPGTRVYEHRMGKIADKSTRGKASKYVVDHKDGDKTNNSPRNLRRAPRGDNRKGRIP